MGGWVGDKTDKCLVIKEDEGEGGGINCLFILHLLLLFLFRPTRVLCAATKWPRTIRRTRSGRRTGGVSKSPRGMWRDFMIPCLVR